MKIHERQQLAQQGRNNNRRIDQQSYENSSI